MANVLVTLITNRPDISSERWIGTIGKLSKLSEYHDMTYSILLQPPFTVEDCDKVRSRVVEALGPKNQVVVEHFINPPGPFNFRTARNQAMLNVPYLNTFDYVLITDDDFKFSGPTPKGYDSWERYHQAIKYLDENRRCGGVLIKGMFGSPPVDKGGNEVSKVHDEYYSTNRGILHRNVMKYDNVDWIYSNECFDYPSALEDAAACFSRIELGYYYARIWKSPTTPLPVKQTCADDIPDDNIYSRHMVNEVGIGKAIRERYDDPTWEVDQKRMPKKLNNLKLEAMNNRGWVVT
ncbi:hypothetical protein EVB94_261 [Rhizobium phage RHph_TM40]|uniref:Uncharacterized protein n=2 Tax=Cuauhnahuacvirus TaxID=3044696 RepID=A0A7S5RDN5_9CAUD|nr:hypothetical protein PQC16_gp261 [Rhizobium phage RHph_TM30]YP_010671411.1 hypothetical protein PQC17_gp262 [Rhizobium phage RHph_Y65]QIG71732.1 hypothetical protein EVB94_261 [Rhizobium phage RHph_TM40]QIG72095.1 hypothetical protein EVB95_261 [Rhizobium phage RHph_TM2_3B]QIG72457.1 hypothetical protein EVB96_261 [Rhizobium phage RHph_TM3_3_6]QIG71368.1 hypothetical protein EVB93_261 [Rhizobium phage RHph_TM30]QIG72820.1 hypothetical protein EVB97_262 [Rhizobium phage RHph_Y65]